MRSTSLSAVILTDKTIYANSIRSYSMDQMEMLND